MGGGDMLRSIHLTGILQRTYGGPFRIDVASASEAAHALACQLPGFRRMFADYSYYVRIKERWIDDVTAIAMPQSGDVEFVTAVVGSKGKGKAGGMLIAGVIILAVAVTIVTGGLGAPLAAAALTAGTATALAVSAAASIGVSLILSGAMGLLSPVPKMASTVSGRHRDTNSFLYQGPVNSMVEGGVVPLVFGRCVVGSTLVAGGTMVTSAISQGIEEVILDAIPIGQYAYNFVVPADNIITVTGNIDINKMFRLNTATIDTVWDWERLVDWHSTTESNPPYQTYLMVGGELSLGSGDTYGFGFWDDYYRLNQGIRSTVTRLTIPAGVTFQHRASFKMNDNPRGVIQLHNYYSRLKRIA